MIWESRLWKDDLLSTAKVLRRRRTQKRWPEASFAKIEKELMLGFYSIRKLHEASKLSTATVNQRIPLASYPATGKIPNLLNWTHAEDFFAFDSRTDVEHGLLFICNQFVHSYVFITDFDSSRMLSGIYFASDRQRRSSLLRISLDTIIALFEQSGNDYPSSLSFRFDTTKMDYVISAK